MRHIALFFLFFIAFEASAQIINIEERRIRGTLDSIHWYGHINFGLNATKVRETVLNFNTDMQLEYKWKKNIVLSLTTYNLVKAGQKSYVNSAFQHLRYNYKIKDYFTWEVYGQLQNNQIQHIKVRALAGSGLRLRFFKMNNGQSRAYLGSSLMYEYNEFKGIFPKKFLRLSNYFSITYKPSKTVFFQNTLYIQPSLPNFNAIRMSNELDLEFKFTAKLSFRCAFNWFLDATLPPDIPARTYSLQNGIRLNL